MTNIELLRVASTLARSARCEALVRFDDYYKGNCTVVPHVPLNTQENVSVGISAVLEKRRAELNSIQPYWLPAGNQYIPSEALNATIQFFDEHDGPLPVSVLPPQEDVCRYIESVLGSDTRLTVPEQLKILIEITNNLVGAVNLGFMASRIMARGADTRAYPGIQVGPNELIAWDSHVAQFEKFSEEKYDGPGDTYYFWTHAFIALLGRFPGFKSLDIASKKGTEIMVFARKYVAGTPTVSGHREASLIGRNAGVVLGDCCRSYV